MQSTTHNLRNLWDAFKTIASEVEVITNTNAPPKEDIEGIEAYIDQLHAVDKGSITFRYPLTREGDVSSGEIARINLGRFCEHMEGLCNYLEGYESYYQHLGVFTLSLWPRRLGPDVGMRGRRRRVFRIWRRCGGIP